MNINKRSFQRNQMMWRGNSSWTVGQLGLNVICAFKLSFLTISWDTGMNKRIITGKGTETGTRYNI